MKRQKQLLLLAGVLVVLVVIIAVVSGVQKHIDTISTVDKEIIATSESALTGISWTQDGETLVVITADHETGGLTLVDGDLNEGKIVCKFSTGGHSGVMVPVYAFGPGAENFTGIFENTDIFWKIKTLLNL